MDRPVKISPSACRSEYAGLQHALLAHPARFRVGKAVQHLMARFLSHLFYWVPLPWCPRP